MNFLKITIYYKNDKTKTFNVRDRIYKEHYLILNCHDNVYIIPYNEMLFYKIHGYTEENPYTEITKTHTK